MKHIQTIYNIQFYHRRLTLSGAYFKTTMTNFCQIITLTEDDDVTINISLICFFGTKEITWR